jgi:hypothetical protein
MTEHTCQAPMTDDDDPRLCGAPATEKRVVEGVVFHLCAKHADELDRERAKEAN